MINKLYFDEIDSTNTYCKNHINELNDKTCVIAKSQTNGRGRLGRIWNSNYDENILCSIVYKKVDSNNPYIYSLLVGAAIHKVLNSYIQCLIKWPNDIYTKGKKICGILCEMVNDNLIIGFGINVNQTNFKGDFRTNPTSLKLEINKQIDKDKMSEEVIQSVINTIELYNNNEFDCCKYISNYLYGKGQNVICTKDNLNFKGVLHSIDKDGSVVIKINDRYEKFLSGEITFNSQL